MSTTEILDRGRKRRKLRSDWQLKRQFNGVVYLYKDEIPTNQATARAIRWRKQGYLVRLLPGHTPGWTLTYYCVETRKKTNV